MTENTGDIETGITRMLRPAITKRNNDADAITNDAKIPRFLPLFAFAQYTYFRCEITYLSVSNSCPLVHFSNVTTVGE